MSALPSRRATAAGAVALAVCLTPAVARTVAPEAALQVGPSPIASEVALWGSLGVGLWAPPLCLDLALPPHLARSV